MIITTIICVFIALFLSFKRRYRWIYILYKTIPRDLKAGFRFAKLNLFLKLKERQNITVPKRFASLADKHPNKVAIYFEEQIWTFSQVDKYSNKIGHYFKSLGYKSGDTIALLLSNRPEYVCIWLGLAKIGVTTALVNTNLTKDSLLHCINVANSKALIFGSEFDEVIKGILPKIGQIKLFQFHEDDTVTKEILPPSVDLRASLVKSKDDSLSEFFSKGKMRDNLVYIYTSGTTGLPKAAVINNIRYIFFASASHVMTDLKTNDIMYDPLPLYHTAGGMVGVGQCILFGITIAIRKKFSASNFWKDCVKYNCTVAQYIGEICRYLLAVPETPDNYKHNVKMMFGNGLKAQIWDKFIQKFHIQHIYELYGATEGNSNLININSKSGAVGFVPRYAQKIYPVTLIKCNELTGEPIRGPDGYCIRCEPGEPGIFIGKINPKKSLNAFLGYADKKATEKKIIENAFKHGDMYFNSGDILVQDEFGYYYFKDRTGDTFRWKGENVATSEVEAVISNLVSLNDAVVYGVEIPNSDGKAGMAAIVDTNNQIDLKMLGKELKSHLPSYAVPIFLRIMQSVPLTGTFKLKKVDLQQEGYDINKITDDLYFYDVSSSCYIPLTNELYAKLMSGKMRV